MLYHHFLLPSKLRNLLHEDGKPSPTLEHHTYHGVWRLPTALQESHWDYQERVGVVLFLGVARCCFYSNYVVLLWFYYFIHLCSCFVLFSVVWDCLERVVVGCFSLSFCYIFFHKLLSQIKIILFLLHYLFGIIFLNSFYMPLNCQFFVNWGYMNGFDEWQILNPRQTQTKQQKESCPVTKRGQKVETWSTFISFYITFIY